MKSNKGICPGCGQVRWLGGKHRTCKPCAYPIGICDACSNKGKIFVDGLCYCCYQHRQVDKQLRAIESKFLANGEYNRYLFDLYLRYIRRYRLAYFHGRQASKLADVLSENQIRPIQGWKQILLLSEHYKLHHPNKKGNGCAFIKIGYMLQELGVIGPKRDERAYWIERSLSSLPESIRDDVTSYINRLKRLKMADNTLENHLRFLRNFFSWLENVYPQINILSVTEAKVIEYAAFLQSRSEKVAPFRSQILGLRRFYSWLVYSKKILENPCANLNPARAQQKINICSDEHITLIMRYVTDSGSDPDGAFLISLILFYGLTTGDLQNAKFDVVDDHLTIVLERPRRTYGRHFYNRDELLRLPKNTDWFVGLQQRFRDLWQVRYDATKKTFPCRRLLLPEHHHYTRPLSDTLLVERIYAATVAATGFCIPPNVLRQTCGHLYSQSGDGSLLSRLGWSPQFAFHYTWLPRKIVSASPPPKPLDNRQN